MDPALLATEIDVNEEDPVGLPRSSRNVRDALRAAGSDAEVILMPDSTRTAAEAAAALGCEVGAIANSLILMADGQPLLVMTSGAHRVDTVALARTLGKQKVRRASAEQVRAATGQVIGGVAPLGHPEPLQTIVDEDLAQFEQIWASAGTPNTLFSTTFDELCNLTGGASAPVV